MSSCAKFVDAGGRCDWKKGLDEAVEVCDDLFFGHEAKLYEVKKILKEAPGCFDFEAWKVKPVFENRCPGERSFENLYNRIA